MTVGSISKGARFAISIISYFRAAMVVNDCICSNVGALPERNGERQVRNNYGHSGFTDIPSGKIELYLDDGEDAVKESNGDLTMILSA